MKPTPSTSLKNKKIERPDVDARIYKVAGRQSIELHICYPRGYSATAVSRYPVAVSVHGGGWSEGPIEWGYGDAQFMASLGFVGVAVGYRLALSGEASALDSMLDVSSAIRWVRLHAAELHVAPDRVLAIGHSAGGHMVLSAAMFPWLLSPGEDENISSVPDAVVALAPAIDIGRDPYFIERLRGDAEATDCSPLDNIRKVPSPIRIFHGSGDELLPVAPVELFTRKMREAGNDIELRIFPKGGHNFCYETERGRTFWQESVREFVRSRWC